MDGVMQPEMGKAKRYKVVCPVTGKDGKTHWMGSGVGFPNRDGSVNLYLDMLPTNGKLQLREWDDDDRWGGRGGRERSEHANGNGGGNGSARDRFMSLPMAQTSAAAGGGDDTPF